MRPLPCGRSRCRRPRTPGVAGKSRGYYGPPPPTCTCFRPPAPCVAGCGRQWRLCTRPSTLPPSPISSASRRQHIAPSSQPAWRKGRTCGTAAATSQAVLPCLGHAGRSAQDCLHQHPSYLCPCGPRNCQRPTRPKPSLNPSAFGCWATTWLVRLINVT